MDNITSRILKQLGDASLLDKLLALPKSDLNSLLLRLFQMQGDSCRPSELLTVFANNRFCAPSKLDPEQYHGLERELLKLAKENDIEGILLSPAAPLFSCSAFGCVNQNNVVSALRGVEILADPTNMLAVLLAHRLKSGEADHQTPQHLCTTARALRGQAFPDIEGYYAHFGLFCLVSAGKSAEKYHCEEALLAKHLQYYHKLFGETYPLELSVVIGKRSGYPDDFFDNMTQLFTHELPNAPVTFDLEKKDNQYYKGINFKLYADTADGRVEVGDGGFVDWMQQLNGSKKGRCLISGIGLDRLMTL